MGRSRGTTRASSRQAAGCQDDADALVASSLDPLELKVPELRVELKRRGESTVGVKDALRERLQGCIMRELNIQDSQKGSLSTNENQDYSLTSSSLSTSSGAGPAEFDYTVLRVNELRNELKQRGEETTGVKDVLVARLKACIDRTIAASSLDDVAKASEYEGLRKFADGKKRHRSEEHGQVELQRNEEDTSSIGAEIFEKNQRMVSRDQTHCKRARRTRRKAKVNYSMTFFRVAFTSMPCFLE